MKIKPTGQALSLFFVITYILCLLWAAIMPMHMMIGDAQGKLHMHDDWIFSLIFIHLTLISMKEKVTSQFESEPPWQQLQHDSTPLVFFSYIQKTTGWPSNAHQRFWYNYFCSKNMHFVLFYKFETKNQTVFHFRSPKTPLAKQNGGPYNFDVAST